MNIEPISKVAASTDRDVTSGGKMRPRLSIFLINRGPYLMPVLTYETRVVCHPDSLEAVEQRCLFRDKALLDGKASLGDGAMRSFSA
jgi:hypothetical protein